MMKIGSIRKLIRRYLKIGFSIGLCKKQYIFLEYQKLFPEMEYNSISVEEIEAFFRQRGEWHNMEADWAEALRLEKERNAKDVLTKQKQEKVKKLSTAMAKNIISERLSSMGLKYAFAERVKWLDIYVALNDKYQVLFHLSYLKTTTLLEPLFESIQKILEIQQSEVPIVKLWKYDRTIRWKE